MAVEAAHEKAALMAGELGERVGRPRTIGETAFGYAGNFNSSGANGSQNADQIDSSRLTQGDSIPAGQIAVQDDVSITFDLAENDVAPAD